MSAWSARCRVPRPPKADFSTGDMIESIKGIATRDMPLAYAAMLLQGEAGTTVDLSVVRVRRPEPQAMKLTRAVLTLPSVESKMLDGQGGLHQYRRPLAGASSRKSPAAVQKLHKDGAQKLVWMCAVAPWDRPKTASRWPTSS